MHSSFLRRWVESLYLRQFLKHFGRFDLRGVDAVTAFAETGVTSRLWSGGSQKDRFRVWTPPRLQAFCSTALRYDCLRVSGLIDDAVCIGIGP